MPKKTTTQPRMSDDAVKAKTGKVWKEWLALLDKAGAKKMTHQEIAELLHSKHGVGPWWTQMVTVTYEHARGLRDRHERPDGFSVSVSRTIQVPLSALYQSFADEKSRRKWLPEDSLVVRKATKNKSMRVTWSDRKTSVEIYFADKKNASSQVVVQHSKLPDAKAAARMKVYWGKALNQLRDKIAG